MKARTGVDVPYAERSDTRVRDSRLCICSPSMSVEEIVYEVTNLPRKQANASRLLALQQAHWRVENRLHYARDVTFTEDRSRVCTGNAPEVMAALRNLVISLIHRSGSSHIAASRRFFAYHPEQALAFLLRKPPQQ